MTGFSSSKTHSWLLILQHGWIAFVTFPKHVINYLSPFSAYWHNEMISSLLVTSHYSLHIFISWLPRNMQGVITKRCLPSILVYCSGPSAMIHISHSHMKFDIFSMLNMFLLNCNSWTCFSSIYIYNIALSYIEAQPDGYLSPQLIRLCWNWLYMRPGKMTENVFVSSPGGAV